ncbi:hypothetical protein [Acidimangrovimonas pyrenivorans]|uniref:Uncharacterized protein n=1 Tax=Acidimangrovimonas pyrenivorans TaxID=2030798 RepID=A0ABV7AGJ0_9RHOB
MPELIRLYIRHVLIGWGISALFCVGLIWFDVAGLRHLVLETQSGWIAAFMLFISNGVVFAGVQFGIAVMRMAEDDDGPRGGRRQETRSRPALLRALVPVRVEADDPRRQH